jgi:hypothetical protein
MAYQAQFLRGLKAHGFLGIDMRQIKGIYRILEEIIASDSEYFGEIGGFREIGVIRRRFYR